MNNELKDILSNSNKDIDNQKLMDYVSQELSKEESHDLEKMMADDEFINDAIEGLAGIKDKKNLSAYTEQINRQLQQQLKRKNRKEKRKLKEQPWLYFSIVLFLILVIVSFLIIKKSMDKSRPQAPSNKTVYFNCKQLNDNIFQG